MLVPYMAKKNIFLHCTSDRQAHCSQEACFQCLWGISVKRYLVQKHLDVSTGVNKETVFFTSWFPKVFNMLMCAEWGGGTVLNGFSNFFDQWILLFSPQNAIWILVLHGKQFFKMLF